MLSAEQVIPFLSSDDAILRTHAANFFSDAAFAEFPLTADQCWSSIDQAGLPNAQELIRLLRLTSQNNASTRQLLASLNLTNEEEIQNALIDALAEISFEQLTTHREEIFARSDLPEKTRAHLQNRLQLAELPIDTLWQHLESHAQAANKLYWNEFDHSIESRLIEALARHGQPTIDRALAVLNDPDSIDETLEIFAIDILGKMRHRPAMEQLIQTFIEADDDDDVLHASLENALPLTGGLDLIAPLESRFYNEEWPLRLYGASAIARLRHPDAEAALIRLYDNDKNVDAHVNLAFSLLALCTTEALPVLVDLARDGFPEPAAKTEYEEALVACSLMTNFDFDELPLLREVVVTHALLNKKRREIAKLRGISVDQLDDDLHTEDFQDDYESGAGAGHARAVQTIRNKQPKIGRNDPCPCGSGKKYKKCCLK